MFKNSFKYYKSKVDPPDLSTVIDFDLPINEKIAQPFKNLSNVAGKHFGVLPPSQWKVYQLATNPGLIFIRNPFTSHGQRYWIARCLRDYPKAPHSVNMVNSKGIPKAAIADWWSCMQSPQCLMADKMKLKAAMRWATLGYHHDWDTKVYTEGMKNEFPCDLGVLSRYFADALGFRDYSAEAAIVNFYPVGTTLAGHTDHSEKNLDAPLFSFSFGQKAIFLIGGKSFDVKPSAVFLKSGDIAVMSRESRLSYHAVPRIMKDSVKPWTDLVDDTAECNVVVPSTVNDDWETESKRRKCMTSDQQQCDIDAALWNSVKDPEFWKPFGDYVRDCRININVRQVLHSGDVSL